MHRPRCQETRERNRAGHTRLPQATGEVRPHAPNPSPPPPSVAPAKAGASGGGYIPQRLPHHCEPHARRGNPVTTLHRPKGDKQPTRHNNRN